MERVIIPLLLLESYWSNVFDNNLGFPKKYPISPNNNINIVFGGNLLESFYCTEMYFF